MQTHTSISRLLYLSLILSCLALPLTRTIHAQQLKSEVVFHAEMLPTEERDYLKGLDQEIQDEISSYPWTDGRRHYELPLRMELFFEKYTRPGGLFHGYSASIVTALKTTGLQLRSKRWDFKINRDYRFRFTDTYDTFGSLLQFHIWICLGFDADMHSLLGGQQYYEKARLIGENSRFESQYQIGWDQRQDIIRNLTENKMIKELRSAAFYLEAGSYYLEEDDYEKALPTLKKTVDIILTLKPEDLELHWDNHIFRFIDIEFLAETLDYAGETELLDQLARWDPDNSDTYWRKKH